MKPRTICILLVILAIVVLIAILATNKLLKDNPSIQEPVARRAEVSRQWPIVGERQSSLPAKASPGITIVKPAVQKVAVSEQEKNIQKIAPVDRDAVSGLTAVWAEKDDTSKIGSGITKINGKLPTEKESKEMNARGIIMY